MSEPISMTPSELRRLLSHHCDIAGGQTAWAAKHGIARSTVVEAVAGRRDLSEAMINALGFCRVTRYVPMRRSEA